MFVHRHFTHFFVRFLLQCCVYCCHFFSTIIVIWLWLLLSLKWHFSFSYRITSNVRSTWILLHRRQFCWRHRVKCTGEDILKIGDFIYVHTHLTGNYYMCSLLLNNNNKNTSEQIFVFSIFHDMCQSSCCFCRYVPFECKKKYALICQLIVSMQ